MLSHNDVVNLPENFKEYLELRSISEKQMAQIEHYQKEIALYQQKIQHLEQLLLAVTPTILPTDEEIIARSQLSLFRERVAVGNTELSLDETRKIEIYTRILNQALNKKEPTKQKDVTPVEELLLLAEDNYGTPDQTSK